MSIVAAFVALIGALSGSAFADQLSLTLVPAAPSDAGLSCAGELHAQPVAGASDLLAGVSAVSQRIDALPADLRLDLRAQLVWHLRLQSERCWAAPRSVFTGAASDGVELKVWPLAKVYGALRIPPGESVPATVSARWHPPGVAPVWVAGREPLPPQTEPAGEASCPVSDGGFTCAVPAATIDLHLRVRGFVSHHAWGLRLVPGERRDLGIWRLVRGSTLLGRVVFAHDRLPASACAVEVEPMLSGPASKEALGQKQGLGWTGKTDDRGWFVVDGLLPGRYMVSARKAGFAPTRAFPVVVEEGLESEITEPLALARPLELHLKVVPPLDGMQRPWMLQLAEQGDAPNHLKTVFRQPVSDDGTFKRGGLSPGRYWARLEDDRGSRMLQHEFELTEGTTHLELRVTPVAVLGSVTLGGRPLVARLAFGGRHGSERVVMESDGDGQFSGDLPHEGRWQVDVDAEDPRVSRTLQGVLVDRASEGAAWLELKLEGTSIEGTVVDESRRRIPGATVLVLEPSGRAVTSVVSEEDGSFAVFGVAAGRLGVQALHATREGEMASEPVAVVVAEDEPSPRVELVLRHGREITGRVVSFLGEPVAYAGVLFEVDPAELPNPSGYAQTMTDMAGGFTLRLGSSVRQGAIVAQAPGFAQRAVRWAAGEPTPVVVQVDPFGGALRVDLGALEDEVASRQRFLAVWQDGAFFAEEVLSRWAALIGQNPVTGGGRRFQRLSMGNYRVCALTLPELVGLATMQAPPPQGACDAGVIVPGGELAITLGGGSE